MQAKLGKRGKKIKAIKPSPQPASVQNSVSVESATGLLKHATAGLRTPGDLFSGLKWSTGMAPDNVILFKRTDTSAFRPEGVSNNYHLRYELVVVIERGGPVRIGDSNYILHANEAALIFPNQFHHYMDVERGHMEWLFITFELQNPGDIASLKNSPRTLDFAQMHSLSLIVMEYVHPVNGTPNVVEISCQLSRLLRSMVNAPQIPADRRNMQPDGKAKGNGALDRARDVILEKINEYVRKHLKEASTIGDLARDLGYSVSHLRAVFRNQLGVSLGKYIRESRLSEAASLLQSTDKNVSAVVEECGFKSSFAFSRAFKKAYGVAPKAYSRQMR